MSEGTDGARHFYCEVIPAQFNATFAAQKEAGARDATAFRVHEAMRSVNASLCVVVRGESESRFTLNIEKGVMRSSDAATHTPLLTLIHDEASLEAFSRASGNSVLGFLAGLAGLGNEMKLTRQRLENLGLLTGSLYFELTGNDAFSLTFVFGDGELREQPDCSIYMDDETYGELSAGSLTAQDAFMNERVRVEGEMELAIQLAFAALAPDED